MVLLIGRVMFYVGLVVTTVSLIAGFGFMFKDYDTLAKIFLMIIPFGFILTFTGLSTIVMFAPRDDDK